ncbi:MAG: DNA mismatch repair endonuclease MutL [Planctomycetaceae bacterium]|jgi:DNA mismatch repair protein MutL|nr:DNA mismatch repair endonuclease MutL [Planctomycetaceae bacterium]
MPIIHQLSISMINKIAAGEVIERPASVIKELVENSVDAGATRIDVSVDKGGTELIRIVDNGCGIEAEQLPLALSSHATSKISDPNDLFQIRTFGFRGEALASIAEISQMVVRSRTPECREGAEIRSDGGAVSSVNPCGHPIGTSIEIRNLFFNTPVRRKYLRSNQTELGHVTETFLRLVIPHPNIHFTLRHNDRTIHDLPPNSNGIERIAKLFGKEIASDLIAVESRRGNFSVSGHVAHPNHSRSNNRLQYFFLNRRHIRDRALQHALTEAYRGLLTVGRFPIAFLHVEIPPDQVDVNVHPTKMEVRFLDSTAVYGHFLSAIRERFLTADLISRPSLDSVARFNNPSAPSAGTIAPRLPTPSTNDGENDQDESPFENPNVSNAASRYKPQADFDKNDPRLAMADQTAEQLRQEILGWAKNIHGENSYDNETKEERGGASTDAENDAAQNPSGGAFRLSKYAGTSGNISGGTRQNDNSPETQNFQHSDSRQGLDLRDLNGELMAAQSYPFQNDLSPNHPQQNFVASDATTNELSKVTQIHNRYLVIETEDGLAIIDQHAVHERVLYERLKQRMAKGTAESQKLLSPIPVDLTPSEAACVLENLELFAKLGLPVDHFGGATILINGYPAAFPESDPLELLQSLLEPLMTSGKKPDRNDLLDEMMHQMSCKAAIKAGDKLRPDAMTELLQLAREEIYSHHCPHGRPSTLVFTCRELDKLFKRL